MRCFKEGKTIYHNYVQVSHVCQVCFCYKIVWFWDHRQCVKPFVSNLRYILIKSVIDCNGATTTILNAQPFWMLLEINTLWSFLASADGRTDRQTYRRTDRRYQTYYLPCFTVDNKVFVKMEFPRKPNEICIPCCARVCKFLESRDVPKCHPYQFLQICIPQCNDPIGLIRKGHLKYSAPEWDISKGKSFKMDC